MGHDYTGYFQELLERVKSASTVRFREGEAREEEMTLNDCHRNVDRWVENHIGAKAMRGWLFWPADEAGRYIFMAHSVVEENGELFDLTPLDGNTPREGLIFLKHIGAEEAFLEMKRTCSQVVYPQFTYDEWHDQPFQLEDDTMNS